MADLRPQRPNLRPQRPALKPENLDLRPERLDLHIEAWEARSEACDAGFKAWETGFESWEAWWGGVVGQMNERINKQTKGTTKVPLSPFGAAAQKVKSWPNHPLEFRPPSVPFPFLSFPFFLFACLCLPCLSSTLRLYICITCLYVRSVEKPLKLDHYNSRLYSVA